MFKRFMGLFFILQGVLLITWQMQEVTSQLSSIESVRVISLASIGRDRANAVVFSPDGRQLAVGASAGVYLFDPKFLSQSHYIPTGTWARSLAISPDGRLLGAGLFDNTARLWSLSDLQPIQTFGDHGDWVRSIAFTPDGKLLATAAEDNTVRLWNVENGSLEFKVENLEGVRSLAISPDGEILALGLKNNTIQLINLADGLLLKTLMGHEGWVRCLVFSPDGQILASGAFDATARLWDIASGQLIFTLSGHKSSVLGIAFSPDGATIATGSVDKTVRLWKISDGGLITVLTGHTGFVYTVDFSPDGLILASGADDNTVRLWDLSMVPGDIIELPAAPSDCRVCHHPTSSTSPPAVVEVRCEACHQGGASLNWCPNFSRSLSLVYGAGIHTISPLHESGIQVPSTSMKLTIFSPANGEVLYSDPQFIAPVTVSGNVATYDYLLSEVEVRLEVWFGTEMISSMTQIPDRNGYFTFLLGVNPDGNRQIINDPAAPYNCFACHDDFVAQALLPSGDIHLIIQATTKNGERASDERWVIVDISSTKRLQVEVEDSSTGELIEGLTLRAFTRLYEWRGRVATAVSDEHGLALFDIETLTQASTVYEISVPDQVVDGVFYFSQQTQTVGIEPGATSIPPIHLLVGSEQGQISGIMATSEGLLPESVPIWAFALPAGPFFKTNTTRDGLFSFENLPVSKYLVFPDVERFGFYSLSGNQQEVDLTQTPINNAVLTIDPLNSTSRSGIVRDEEGNWLPFAWLVAPEESAFPVDIESGTWTVYNGSMDGQNWVVSAPGYYSQEIKFSDDILDAVLKIELQRRPNMDVLQFGDGTIFIPAETYAEISESKIELENGWVWGEDFKGATFLLVTPEAEIKLLNGQFALERLPGKVPWFYLFNGQAELLSLRTGQSLNLESSGMIALLEQGNLIALPYEHKVVSVLRQIDGTNISSIWKPSLTEQISTTLARLGINTAQVFTFIIYCIAISSLIIFPWFIFRWRSKHRRVSGEKHE